jgi:predicted nucleic acid-binding protein
VILPGVNVLVHAHNSDSAVHQAARLSDSEGVGRVGDDPRTRANHHQPQDRRATAGGRRRHDRMISVQALVHRASLVTMNADDYADIPGLSLLAW